MMLKMGINNLPPPVELRHFDALKVMKEGGVFLEFHRRHTTAECRRKMINPSHPMHDF